MNKDASCTCPHEWYIPAHGKIMKPAIF